MSFAEEHFSEDTYTTVEEIPEPEPGRVTWIDIRGLGDGTLVEALGARFGVHPLAISDIVNVGQRPKVDVYQENLFVTLRMVTLDEEQRLQWEQVSLFIAKGLVLSFQEKHVDCLDPLRERIRGARKTIRSSPADYLGSMIIDTIVDGYFPVLEALSTRLESLEDEVLEDQGSEILPDLYLTKRDLAEFRRSTWPLRDALAQLARTEEVHLSHTTLLHLRDTLDHAMQVVEVTESCRELLASLIDVHLSMVGQRTNEVMRVLTVISAIFIPLTFLAGIYGMNFDRSQPLNLPELGWPYGYVFFWGVSISIAVVLLVVFRRLGWLGGR